MAGWVDRGAIAAAVDAGETFHFEYVKTPWASGQGGANNWSSWWLVAGAPAAGAAPATTPGTTYTNATGSINFRDRAPDTKFLSRVGLHINGIDDYSLMVYDRLVAVSGISLTSTGDKTINSAALPRYTSGEGVQAWLEVTTNINGSVTLSANSYTDHLGNTGHAGPSFATGVIANQTMIPVPVASGDLGMRAIATLNVSATAAATGIVNVVFLKPIACIRGTNMMWREKNTIFEYAAFPRIYDGASLAFAWLRSTATAPNANDKITGTIHVVYG